MNSKRLLLCACMLLQLDKPAEASPWYEDYSAAEQLVEEAEASPAAESTAQKFRQARELLHQSLEIRPDSRLKKLTYSNHFINYLPYYYLGRASEGLGLKEEAITHYLRELEEKAIQGLPEKERDLQQRLERLTLPAPPPPSATPTKTARPLPSSTPTQPPRPSSTPTPTPSPTHRPTRTPTHHPPTPTPSPTWTPFPSSTPTPSATPSPSSPPSPSPTPTQTPAKPTLPPAPAPSPTPSPGSAFELTDQGPGFSSVLLALPISAGITLAASWIVRWRRRKQAVKKSFNPYIAGTPVLNEGMFFGRRDLLQQVLSTLHNNSLLLFGERRIGKTSLLHSIHRHLQTSKDPQYAFFPVLVDLEGTPEESFFALLMSEIIGQLDAMAQGLELRFKADMDKSQYDGTDFVHDLRTVIRKLKDQSSKLPKLILLLDEVDVLNTYSPRTNQRLRSIFMKTFAAHLGLVMAGVQISKSWDSEGSPWYNFFEEIPVRPLSQAEARDLVRRPVEGIFQYETAALDRILELSEAKPYLIQKICIACVHRVTMEKRKTITLADVEAVLPTALGGRSE